MEPNYITLISRLLTTKLILGSKLKKSKKKDLLINKMLIL